VDELVVRRELAINFVLNHPKYDAYDAIPGWARRTLADHSGDPRAYVYTLVGRCKRCKNLGLTRVLSAFSA